MTRFADQLIEQTIHNAKNIPFYQQFWGGIPSDTIKTVSDLAHLPVLHKPDALTLLSTFNYDKAPALLSHSSGTTSGKITVRCRSDEELACIWELLNTPKDPDDEGLKPLSLTVECANHGQNIPLPGSSFGLRAVGFDRDVIDHVIQQLTHTYAFPGYTSQIHTMSCTIAFLKLLTSELIDRGFNPAELGLQHLITFGEHMTPVWFDRFKSLWRTALLDRYSSSELIGGARRCQLCGRYSFDPISVPEMISLETGMPVGQGVGSLVVTELYPFSQLQPLIRYEVGDLFELHPVACDGTKAQTFRFLGRKSMCLFDPDSDRGEPLLYSAEVAAVLDETPHIRRSRDFHGLQLNLSEEGLGAPLAKTYLDCHQARPTIVLAVATHANPILFPASTTTFINDIRQRMLAGCKNLSDLIDKSGYDFKIKISGPESLEVYTGS